MKKLLLLLILTTCVFSTNVFAIDLESIEFESYIEDIDDNIVSPFAETTIFNDAFRSSNYSREFKVYPVNGKNLNIYVENEGNNPIEVNVSIGGASLDKVTLQPNKSYLYSSKNITYEATWKLTVNDRTGASMSGTAKARQFD